LKGFPEFEQFYVRGFPRRTQVGLSLLRLPISPRPRGVIYSGKGDGVK